MGPVYSDAMDGPPLPTVSVIIPAYGVAHLVADALHSLQAQTLADWEAVVIDDGAPDDVAGALQSFANDPRIRLIQTDNGGLPTARNRAIAASRAPLIALLDGDDMLEPDYLARMTAAVSASPDIGLVSCDATYFGDSRVGERFSAYVPQEPPVTLARVLDRRFNIFITALFRREAFERAGGFDSSLRSAEDLDLWLRILADGWQAAYMPAPLARYRRRAGQMSGDTARLLAAEDQVYAAMEQRLGERPERAIATARRVEIAQSLAQIEGEALIRAGQARSGVARLWTSGIARRSPRWAVILPLMTIAPFLALPLLRLRDRMN